MLTPEDWLDECRRHLEAGEHEALEDAVSILESYQLPVPAWMATALRQALRHGETAKQRRDRQARWREQRVALAVLESYAAGLALEPAYAAVADEARAGVNAITADGVKKAFDRFLARRPGVIKYMIPPPPGRPLAVQLDILRERIEQMQRGEKIEPLVPAWIAHLRHSKRIR